MTADAVRALAAASGQSLAAAKQHLENAKPPVLQQWNEAEGWEHPDIVRDGGYWDDVEIVVEASPIEGQS